MATLLSTLHLPARLDAVAFAGTLARHACETVGLDDIATMRAEIAVVEACTNVVKHALGVDGTCTYTVAFEADGNVLDVTIRDAGANGAPYPLASATPGPVASGTEADHAELGGAAPEGVVPDLEHLAEGGYGVPLIFAAAREVAFRREDGLNVLTLRFGG